MLTLVLAYRKRAMLSIFRTQNCVCLYHVANICKHIHTRIPNLYFAPVLHGVRLRMHVESYVYYVFVSVCFCVVYSRARCVRFRYVFAKAISPDVIKKITTHTAGAYTETETYTDTQIQTHTHARTKTKHFVYTLSEYREHMALTQHTR